MSSGPSASFLRRPRFRRALLAFALAILLFVAGRLRCPTSASAPPGLYVLTREPVERGSWVVACLPSPISSLGRRRGYLSLGPCDGSSEVLKQVAALPGDVVLLTDDGIRINGVAVPDTARHPVDRAGRPIPFIPPGRYPIPPGSCWLLGRHPRSWDSRYYGAVPLTGIRAVTRRVLPPFDVTD